MAVDRHKQKAIIVRVPDELGDKLREEAEARGVTVTWMANRLLTEALSRLIPADEFSLTRSVD